MSFDIVGHLRVIDNATRPLRDMTRGLMGFTASAGRAAAAVTGIGAAVTAIASADKLLEKTIKAAAEFEMREVTLTAMFGDTSKKNVDQFMNYLEQRADVSQYSLDDFLDVGKSFVPTTKDIQQLKAATNLAERLGAIDPEQGITGAAYALKEFFSGDAVSLVERFELPRSELNKIKKLPLKEQLAQLDKFLDKLGATNKLIDDQSKTTMGIWRTAIGGVNRAFREMGTEALTSIKPLLVDFNTWLNGPQFQALKKWGVSAFGGLVEGAVNAVRKATSYIQTNFINNPEFQNLTTMEQKIEFVFGKIGDSFNKWWNAGGRDKTAEVTKNVVGFMIDTLEAAGPLITDAALKLGTTIADGVMQGIKDHLNVIDLLNPFKQQLNELNAQFGNAEKLKKDLSKWSTENPGKPMIEGGTLGPSDSGSGSGGGFSGWWKETFEKSGWSHSGGLDNVPYNNYPARLHEGEMVLTSAEARDYRDGNSGKTAPNIVIQNVNIHNEMDYQAFASRLAYDLAM